MSDPPWLDRLNVFASLAGSVLCAVIASTAATVLLPLAVFAGVTSVLCLLIAIPPAAAIRKRRRLAPRSTRQWHEVDNHDPRRLAQDALDHAAKAADLGLPTGEWTDLAAFWTTWADQQDAVKAAERLAQRPTPPKGGGGAGNATLRWDEPVFPLSAFPFGTHWISLHTDDPAPDGVHEINSPRQAVSVPPPVRADQARVATSTCTLTIPRGVTITHFAVWDPDGSLVDSGKLREPEEFPNGGSYSLAVLLKRRVTKPSSGPSVAVLQQIQRQVDELKRNAPRMTGVMRELADDLIAREDHNARCAHTAEMKGAPATRHEIPCDCDHVTAEALTDEINRMKAELYNSDKPYREWLAKNATAIGDNE